MSWSSLTVAYKINFQPGRGGDFLAVPLQAPQEYSRGLPFMGPEALKPIDYKKRAVGMQQLNLFGLDYSCATYATLICMAAALSIHDVRPLKQGLYACTMTLIGSLT